MTRRITVRSGSVPRKVVPPASVASAAGADTDAIHDNVDGEIVLVTEKVSPVGADVLVIEDSEDGDAKKRVQITNLPGGADADAIHDNVASEISAIAAKGTPVGGDFLVIEDSAAANVKKSVTVAALEAILSHDNIAGVTSDDHHAEAHNVASHSDTTATGAELETLTDGSETALHSHAGGGASPLTTKGDLFGYDTDDQRIPIGTDGHVLKADSGEALGVTWAAGAGGTDSDAIHDNVAAEISVIAEKVTPIDADLLLIEDSAASNVKKRVQIGNLPGTGGGGTNLTTKGDLHGYDTGQARIPVGATDGHVLTIDSAEALGVKWAAGSVGSFPGSLLGSDAYAGGTSHVLTVPGGIASGDLMVVYVATRNATTTGPNAGVGWTEILSKDTSTDERAYAWYRVSDGAEVTVPLTFVGTLTISVLVVIAGGTFSDFIWAQAVQSAPFIEATSAQYVIQSFHGMFNVTPWVMPTGSFGASYTELENETSGDAELMVASRDVKYNGLLAGLTPTGGGGDGNPYQVTALLIVDPT